jgi:hypothetical protein
MTQEALFVLRHLSAISQSRYSSDSLLVDTGLVRCSPPLTGYEASFRHTQCGAMLPSQILRPPPMMEAQTPGGIVSLLERGN